MGYSEDEINDASKTQALVCKKLLEIMDLQADIDDSLRDKHPKPFGSDTWKNARPEELQRWVMVAAIQFVLYEPEDWVAGNDDFKVAAEKLLDVTLSQLRGLKEKHPRSEP